MKSGLIKRSFSLTGRRTSVALEQEFWAAVMRIAASRHQTLTQLIAAADAQRIPGQPSLDLAGADRPIVQAYDHT